MNFYLNELSLKKQAASERIAKVWVRQFAGVCEILRDKYELKKIFINDTFYSDELYSNFPMGKLLSDIEVKRRMRNLQQQLFFAVEYPEKYNPNDYIINGDIANGLGLSCPKIGLQKNNINVNLN